MLQGNKNRQCSCLILYIALTMGGMMVTYFSCICMCQYNNVTSFFYFPNTSSSLLYLSKVKLHLGCNQNQCLNTSKPQIYNQDGIYLPYLSKLSLTSLSQELWAACMYCSVCRIIIIMSPEKEMRHFKPKSMEIVSSFLITA